MSYLRHCPLRVRRGLLLVLLFSLVGCSPRPGTSGSPDSSLDAGSASDVPVVNGTDDTHTAGADGIDTGFSPEARTAVIGPAGGTLESGDGGLRLEVPEGALAEELELTVTRVTDPPDGAVGSVYRLEPAGTEFEIPVTVAIRMPEQSTLGEHVVGWKDSDGWKPLLVPMAVTEDNMIAGWTTHFTFFAAIIPKGGEVCECDIACFQECLPDGAEFCAYPERCVARYRPSLEQVAEPYTFLSCYAECAASHDVANFCNDPGLETCCTEGEGSVKEGCICAVPNSADVRSMGQCIRDHFEETEESPSVCLGDSNDSPVCTCSSGRAGDGGGYMCIPESPPCPDSPPEPELVVSRLATENCYPAPPFEERVFECEPTSNEEVECTCSEGGDVLYTCTETYAPVGECACDFGEPLDAELTSSRCEADECFRLWLPRTPVPDP